MIMQSNRWQNHYGLFESSRFDVIAIGKINDIFDGEGYGILPDQKQSPWHGNHDFDVGQRFHRFMLLPSWSISMLYTDIDVMWTLCPAIEEWTPNSENSSPKWGRLFVDGG